MTAFYPYISGSSNISKIIHQLRRKFPATVTTETIKKFSIAPGSERYVINALRFINLIDNNGSKNAENAKAFLHHKEEDFQNAFGKIVKEAYNKLFEDRGDDAWQLGTEDLVTFFRQADAKGASTGQRQANVFQVFATLSGEREGSITQKQKTTEKKANTTEKKTTNPSKKTQPVESEPSNKITDNLSMNIRIEINLPPNAGRETYDDIFKSIRKNLING